MAIAIAPKVAHPTPNSIINKTLAKAGGPDGDDIEANHYSRPVEMPNPRPISRPIERPIAREIG